MAQFADSLVLDERSGICFAYDPRDVNKRRLQNLSAEDCSTLNCFDCAYTAGICAWHPDRGSCVKPSNTIVDISGFRWWQWFDYCEDTDDMCKSSGDSVLG